MKKITQNKKAHFEYFIEQTFVAGIKLQGSEVKSIRAGKVSINEAYITFRNGEVFILNMHIAKFDASSIFNHDETRDGMTVITLSVELHQGLVKLVIALAKGKKLYDKRQTIKDRDLKREQQQALKGKR